MLQLSSLLCLIFKIHTTCKYPSKSLFLLQDIVFFDTEAVGSLTSRLGSDCQQVSRIIGNDLNIMFRNGLQVSGFWPPLHSLLPFSSFVAQNLTKVTSGFKILLRLTFFIVIY